MTLCKLCLKNKPLRSSHIFPHFITDWIRDTSVTEKMRSPFTPNKRIQDTKKVKLLCKDCERLFSKFEKYFSETIFKPVLNSNNPIVDYDINLLRFAVSLSWRMLAASLQRCPWKAPFHKTAAEKAEVRWREFLLDDRDLNNYEHHLLMLRFVTGAPKIKGTDININWYFFRSIDGTIVQNSKEAFVYAKMPGFVFISPINPEPFTHLTGTLIKKRGQFEFYKQSLNGEICGFLIGRSVKVLSPLGIISKRQKDKIEIDTKKRMNKVQDSYGFKLFLAEEEHKNKKNGV
jgi:hypothetical protein